MVYNGDEADCAGFYRERRRLMRTIKLLATLRDLTGAKEITVPFDGGTVRELLHAVQQVSPELGAKILDQDGQLSGLVHVFVRGRNINWLQGLDTIIDESDELMLIPPVGGG
jgi:molybdopterin synthase sulfur carrier subunit